MLRWLDAKPCAGRCGVCGFQGGLTRWVAAGHVTLADHEVVFAKCGECESMTTFEAIMDFARIDEDNTDVFLRQYVESTAGPWEMFWPIACLQDAPAKSLLDVGCGFGFTTDAWKTVMNERASGCDPAPYAAAGRALFGEHIHHALLDDVAELRGATFDVVYSSEVIEHVPDPVAFVSLLKGRLNSNGILVVTTPAADYIVPESDPATTVAALAPGFHGFLFSRDALELLLRSSGFNYVTVECHGERLIAWASSTEIRRSPPEVCIEMYLHYLSVKVVALKDANCSQQKSLRAGFAYRLFKERFLRGQLGDIAALRELLLSESVFAYDLNVVSPAVVAEPLRALGQGPTDFGEFGRYCFPQLAFLFGGYSEHLDQKPDVARVWYELAVLSTQKLCGFTVLAGLEAAAFSWHAQLRLIALDAASAREDSAVKRLLTCIEATVHPDPALGGSAPQSEDIWSQIDAWTSHLLRRRDSAALQRLANSVTQALPQHTFGPDALSFGVLRALFHGYLQLCTCVARGDVLEGTATLTQLRAQVVAVDGVEQRWFALLQARLAGLESQLPKQNTISFAALAGQTWAVQPAIPKRWG